MHTLLFIWAYIAFAFVAPAGVTAVTSAIILLTACAIQVIAKLVSGFQPSFMEAFKAIGLSFFFLFLALLFFASAFFSSAQGNSVALLIVLIFNVNPFLVPFSLFAAFALGFSLSLRTTITSSMLIAALSSVFAALLVIAAGEFIFA
jgi:hypothetical protein